MENNVVYESTTVHNRKMGYIIFILLPIIGVVIIVLSMIPVSTVNGKHFIDHNNIFGEWVTSEHIGYSQLGTLKSSLHNRTSGLIGIGLVLFAPFSIHLFVCRKNALNSKLQISNDSVWIKLSGSFSDKKEVIPLKSDIDIAIEKGKIDKIIGGEKIIVTYAMNKYIFRCIDNADEFVKVFRKAKQE